jgi:RNA polymerase sigma-70 factor (ECF subfamily)
MTEPAIQSDDLQRFRPLLRALAESQLHNNLRKKFDPSDVVQQTLLNAVASESPCRGEGDAAKIGWLKAILQNVVNGIARSYHRDRRNVDLERGLGSASETSSPFDVAVDQTSPSARIQNEELQQQISRAIGVLTEEQRQAIVMRYWQDRPLSEIATALGKSPDAVAGLLYRGMKLIRREMASETADRI